jgi:hypothetical protein
MVMTVNDHLCSEILMRILLDAGEPLAAVVCKRWRSDFASMKQVPAMKLEWMMRWNPEACFVAMCVRGDCAVVRRMLEEKRVDADCLDGLGLIRAAGRGHDAVVSLLLGWSERAPRADCRNGDAFVRAAARGHGSVIRLLLCSQHAPRADLLWAMIFAITHGHTAVVRMLLEWPSNPPRADYYDGTFLKTAAQSGRLDILRLLLEHPVDPCRASRAAIHAAKSRGHAAAVELLQQAAAAAELHQ